MTAAPAAESAAAAAAKESGQAVEVAGRTTEYQRVFANPSGTFTVEQSATPVRVRRGASWTPVDTTLRRHADGSVRPGAALFDVAFSGGGTVPLARLARGSRSLALTWPTALPEPVLAGDTASYPDVLPGVDLAVRAEVDGFAQVLVVKNAQAAKQPQLRRLRFGARTAGMWLRADSAGGFTAVEASGAAVFTSPEPLMWDSKGGAAPTAATSAHSAAGEDARARAPRDGDQIAPMRVEVGADTLTVVPDPALLDSPHFPLYLDPPVHGATRTGWAMVNRSYPGQEYFKWGGTEGMGWTDQEGTHLKRLYFNFDTRPVARKHIVKATFKAFETHSHSCTVSRALLELTSGVTAGTNWANQPTWVQPVTYRDVAYGRTGCTPGGAWVEFNAHSAVANAASKSWAQTTLRLRAADEGNRSGWKRFRNDAVLSIEYNTPPATPTALRTQAPATQCTVSANRPVIPDDPPILTARLNDADGAKGQTVKANFELWENDGKLIETYRTAYKLPNVDYTVQLPRLGAGSYS